MITSQQWQLAQDAALRYEQILVPQSLLAVTGAAIEWREG